MVLVLGMTAPRYLIGSGVEQFEGERRKIAKSFHGYYSFFTIDDTAEEFIVAGVRITRLEKCPGAPPYDSRSLLPAGTRVSGEITLHTIFGIPYRKVVVSCDGGIETARQARLGA